MKDVLKDTDNRKKDAYHEWLKKEMDKRTKKRAQSAEITVNPTSSLPQAEERGGRRWPWWNRSELRSRISRNRIGEDKKLSSSSSGILPR